VVNRAFFNTHQPDRCRLLWGLVPVNWCYWWFGVANDILQEVKRQRNEEKIAKYRRMREAEVAGTATPHQQDLLAVVRRTEWEYSALYA